MMKKHPFKTVSIFLLVILCFLQLGVESQNPPCTTPINTQGECVPLDRCPKLYWIAISSRPRPPGVREYVNNSNCTLPGVERSICCKPNHVLRQERITQKPDLMLTEDCGYIRNTRWGMDSVYNLPWMAVLQYDNGNGTIVDGCGGSLINKRYVLTAASCIQKKSPLRLVNVRLGEHTKNQDEDCDIRRRSNSANVERYCAGPPEDFEIESVVVHPEYNQAQFSNDIGLIRLNKDVIQKSHIMPICLLVTPKEQFKDFTLAGWGVTENSAGSEVIMRAELLKINNTECQQILNDNGIRKIQLTDKQMCASGRDQIGPCQGDTGGPLGRYTEYYNNSTFTYGFVQYGVLSGGVDSCELKSVPGVYSRVDSYIDWIKGNSDA